MIKKRAILQGTGIALLVLSFLFISQTGVALAASNARRGPGGPGGQGGGAGVGAPAAANNGAGAQTAARNGNAAPGSGYATTPLSAAEQAALQDAILEEYGALNLYQNVIKQFGDAYPFSLIARAEQQHVEALVRQAEKYGVAVPANPGAVQGTSFNTLTEACQAGVAAEIADAALYDTLKQVTTHADLIRVYDRLQAASLENHLVAFQTCD